MFSANNFYQWTFETYLKDKSFSMLTYHPMGTRGYKNLQNWVSYSNKLRLDLNELISDSCVLMNDQEPILLESIYNWKKEHTKNHESFGTISDLYYRQEQENYFTTDEDKIKWEKEKDKFVNPVDLFLSTTNDKTFVSQLMCPGIFKPILVHSELNSKDVKELNDEFIPVYVFWHGLISRDWYRHWKHSRDCLPNIHRAKSEKRFLLYARAWTGSRKYRLTFVENIISKNLHSSFKYNFFELDDGYYYKEFCDTDISNYFPKSEDIDSCPVSPQNFNMSEENINQRNSDKIVIDSNSSAYIHTPDYNTTAIQIVAETLFETEKIHLTEKTFQPIVAGQPFLTLAPPGTLQLLKYYGFHTFDHVWDESYDTVLDSSERMSQVIDQIEHINNLSQDKFIQLYEKCLAVCDHNRKHFFSDRFEQQLLSEYDHNIRTAFQKQHEFAKINPGGSRFSIANKICFDCYNTDFFYKQDQHYLKYLLERTKSRYPDQYQAILKQYWWAKRLSELS